MATPSLCPYHRHSSNMALSSGRLVASIISPVREREPKIAERQKSAPYPRGLALLAGDASVDSWFREIYVPQAWRVYLATGLDFREKKKSYLFWVDRSPSLPSAPTLPLYYEGEMMETLFPQNYVYVLRTTTTRHMVSFIDFYFHFLADFQT